MNLAATAQIQLGGFGNDSRERRAKSEEEILVQGRLEIIQGRWNSVRRFLVFLLLIAGITAVPRAL